MVVLGWEVAGEMRGNKTLIRLDSTAGPRALWNVGIWGA